MRLKTIQFTVKGGYFCETFIFANSVKRHICHIKNSRLGHILLHQKDRLISPFCEGLLFTILFAKITKFTVCYNPLSPCHAEYLKYCAYSVKMNHSSYRHLVSSSMTSVWILIIWFYHSIGRQVLELEFEITQEGAIYRKRISNLALNQSQVYDQIKLIYCN